jgi:hypothetical protein
MKNENEDQTDPEYDNFGKYLFILLMAFFLSLKLHSTPLMNHDTLSPDQFASKMIEK